VLTLLWGLPNDPPLARVAGELAALDAPVHVLDQRDVLSTSVDTGVGTIRLGSRELELGEIGAVYLRPYDVNRLPRLARLRTDEGARRHVAAVEQAMYAWLDTTSAFLVNPVWASATNSSKPWQLARVREAGFAVPDTLVTTDPRAARNFVREHRDVVFKSVSGIRSRVRRITPADLDRLDDVRTCPTQFQRRVPGTDVRVHVVGREVFPTRVTCDADDYRYAAQQGREPATLTPTDLPLAVQRRCVQLAQLLTLPVAGVDLRVTPDGEWYCFEVNPSPAFTYYEHHTGQRIARSIAALLVGAAVTRAPAAGRAASARLR
jgi:glutathione synthase/RimK-type ligase-like ATP-grasp enzyme